MNFSKYKQRIKRFYSKWGWLFGLIVILIFALSIRLINYTGVLDYDVLSYADHAFEAAHGNFQFTLNVRDIDFRFFLILPLSFIYTLFGPSEFSTVLYSLLASLLGITLVYAIGRIQANETAGLIAALIWAAFPLNVFLSTLFGPDEILATLTIAAVFFLLWGNKLRGKKALASYSIGICIAIFGVFVKPSAVIAFVFIGIFFLVKGLRNYGRIFRDYLGRIKPSRRLWLLSVGILSALALGFLFFQNQQSPFLFSLFRASWDLSNLFILGKTQEEFPVRGLILNTPLFLVSAPLFVVGFAGLIFKRLQNSILPLLWAGSQFLYFEWGSISINPLVYSPLVAATNDRNVLFVFPPFAVLAGIFLSKAITAGKARLVALLSLLIVIPMAWFLKEAQFVGTPLALISLAVSIAIIGSVLIVPKLNSKSSGWKEFLTAAWLIIVLVACLYPTPPLHISEEYWQRQIKYRNAVASAAQFFVEHPDYPILTLSLGNARELNFLSNFRLGHSSLNVEPQTAARIQIISDPLAWTGSAYIFLRDEINQIQPVPSNWWKMAEYDAGSGRPVLIYRVLSAQDAVQELEAAKHTAEAEPTITNLERLLGAGINAGNTQVSVKTWYLLNQLKPETHPFDLISPLIINNYYENKLSLSGNLLLGDLGRLQIDPGLRGEVRVASEQGETVLSIQVNQTLSEKLGIYDEVFLQPESLYIYLIDVQSTTGVDLLRVDKGRVLDSQDYSDVHGEWEKEVVIFHTPAWASGMLVRIDLVTVNKPGLVIIKHPQLFQVEFEKP